MKFYLSFACVCRNTVNKLLLATLHWKLSLHNTPKLFELLYLVFWEHHWLLITVTRRNQLLSQKKANRSKSAIQLDSKLLITIQRLTGFILLHIYIKHVQYVCEEGEQFYNNSAQLCFSHGKLCPPGWLKYNNQCYNVSDRGETKTWEDSRKDWFR